MIVFEDLGDCGGQDTLAPGDTAVGFTESDYKPTTGDFKGRTAKAVLIMAEDNTVSFTLDGTTPTTKAGTNVGMFLADTVSYVIRGPNNIRNALFIDTVSGGGSAGIIKALFFF